MTLKKLFVVAALGASTLGAGITAQSVFAKPDAATPRSGGTHSRYNRREGGKRMVERMAQELNLSASQKSRIETIMKESRERGRKIREDQKLSETQKRTKMRENREATRKRVDAVLTATQRKKLATMHQQMRDRMRSQRRGQGGPRDGHAGGMFGGPRKGA